jgi:hypothetical protein
MVTTGREESVDVDNVLEESPLRLGLRINFCSALRLCFRFGGNLGVMGLNFIVDINGGVGYEDGLVAKEVEIFRSLNIVNVLNEIL